MRRLFLIIAGLAFVTAATAQTLQIRRLPTDGKRGELGAPLPLPMLQIGRDVLRLAPGGMIYDQSNRAIVHGSLPTEGEVWYTTDARGDVQRLYVLTPAEQAMLDRKPRR